MKTKDWLYIIAAVAAFVLGALLFRGCKQPATVEVVKYLPVNLDSLKATIEPLKIEVPGPERQVVRYVTVPIPDQTTADSIAARYAELAKKYAQMEAELQAAWNSGLGDVIEWGVEEHVYADSLTTPQYFHRWEIVAEGPIVSYTPQIIPFCPPPPAAKTPKLHRAGLFAGAQTMPGSLRPIVGASYGFGVIRVQAGFLPAAYGEKAQGQILTGIEIPVK